MVWFFRLLVTIELPNDVTANDWYLANAKMTGFYRVNYDDKNWQRLLAQAEEDPDVRNIFDCDVSLDNSWIHRIWSSFKFRVHPVR